MGGLVFACIAPHGGDVIAEIAGDAAPTTQVTRRAMEDLGRRMEAARPDTVVVVTPHGVRVANAICIMTTEKAYGMLAGSGGRIEAEFAVDTDLAEQIARRAIQHHSVPAATAIYGASGGDDCYTPLDWGALVPLWFLGARWATPPSIVTITPSRALTLKQLYKFGTAIAEAANSSGRRVALVASADWGHGHDADGPYGFAPESAEFDALIQEIVRSNRLDDLLSTDIDFADRAKIDGLWQAVILAGALQHTPMHGELLSYEAPSYFGMLVASYEPAGNGQ
ncbi:MAG: aromatic ring-opening dioxygenase subunit LigB [Chloroflexota bacterium]